MHPTYEEALRMTKAQVFDYIVANSPETHVAKSWSKDKLLTTFANAFPHEPVETTDEARAAVKGETSDDAELTIRMSFGSPGTKFLIDRGRDPLEEINGSGRGKFTFTPDEAENAIEWLEAAIDAGGEKTDRQNVRNLSRMRDRIVTKLSALEDELS
jgi:hypothetical protein